METGLPTTTGDGVFLTLENLSPLGLLRVTPELLSLAATLDNDPEVLTEEDVGLGLGDTGMVFDQGRAGCLTPVVTGLVPALPNNLHCSCAVQIICQLLSYLKK